MGRLTRQRINLAVFLVFLTIIITVKHKAGETRDKHWDFQAFYLGAQMVAHGQGSQLYDIRAQAAAQMLYIYPARKVTVPDRPFLYPAAVTVFLLPLAKLSMSVAFPFWAAVNLLLLLASLRLLQKILPLPQDNWPLFPAILFAPVYMVLLKGQISIVILFLVTLCFYFLHRNRPFLAGCALGLATFKYQIVLGLLAILVLRRMWRVLGGSALTTSLVAAVSILLSGWRAFVHYPAFIRWLAYFDSVANPSGTVSLRGILYVLLRHEAKVWLFALLSLFLVIIAAIAWRNLNTGFSIALIVSILTAYHVHIDETVLLLVPFAVLFTRIQRSEIVTGLAITILAAGYVTLLTELYIPFALLCYGVIILGLCRTSEQSVEVRMPVVELAGHP